MSKRRILAIVAAGTAFTAVLAVALGAYIQYVAS